MYMDVVHSKSRCIYEVERYEYVAKVHNVIITFISIAVVMIIKQFIIYTRKNAGVAVTKEREKMYLTFSNKR